MCLSYILDACGHQGGFASSTMAGAAKELVYFFDQLFGQDQIVYDRQQQTK